VVFEFIFTRAAHVERFLGALRSSVPVHLVTLWAPLATIIRREAKRPNRERLGVRAEQCWDELAANLAELGVVLDACGPVEATVADARRCIDDGAALVSGVTRAA
jgi:hypothetical protein